MKLIRLLPRAVPPPLIHPSIPKTFVRNYAVYKRFDQRPSHLAWVTHPDPSTNKDSSDPQHPFFRIPLWFWLITGSAGTYYCAHLETIPLTGRRRFMDTSVEAEIATGKQVYIETLRKYQTKILPADHPTTRFITTVAQKIIQASNLSHTKQDYVEFDDPFQPASFRLAGHPHDPSKPATDWKIHVIDEPKIRNAFVIPGGKIFVFTGILPVCGNESGLATVLGHEVAHQVLRHPAERMSSMKIIFLVTGLLSVMGLDPGLCRALVTLLMTLPNSRKSEVEADHIGLNIMASACYDPKEAIGVWKRMDQFDHSSPNIINNATEFLKTHPSHDRRIQQITAWLPEAQSHRDRKCGFTNVSWNQFNQWQPQ